MTWAQDTSEAAVDTSAVQQPPTEAATAAAADRLVPAGGTRSCGHIVNKNGSCGGKGSRSCEVSKDCIQHRDANKPARGKKRKSADADLPRFSVAGTAAAAAAAAVAPSNVALQPVDYTQRYERH